MYESELFSPKRNLETDIGGGKEKYMYLLVLFRTKVLIKFAFALFVSLHADFL